MSELINGLLRAQVGTLTPEQIRVCFETIGVLKRGHFVYSSRLHGEVYWGKDILYLHALLTRRLCEEIAFQMRDDDIRAVLAPAHGGTILSGLVARDFPDQTESIQSFFARKLVVPGALEFKRGYGTWVGSGRKVLALVADIGDGNATRELVNAIRAQNGNVVGLAALSNRKGLSTEELYVPTVFVPYCEYIERHGLTQALPYPMLLDGMC